MSQELRAGSIADVGVAATLSNGLNSASNGTALQQAHQLFEAHAARTPDQLAVSCLDRELSYGELNARADQLAADLRSRGVGPNTLVAISLERSLEMVITILAVMKAGAAYLALDPAYPQERLGFMITDSQPAIRLTNSNLLGRLPACDVPTLLLDAVSLPASEGSNEKVDSQDCRSDLAYVIYTSGSTGKPKGVMISRENLAHYVRSMQTATGVNASDVYLHTASISFSSSVRQLMLPLSVGATVVVATTDEIANPVELFTTIKQRGVTVIDLVPSYWRSCVNVLESLSTKVRAELLTNNLRLILSASEPLLTDVPRAWRFEFDQQAQLLNMLGQTETTGIVATYAIEPTEDDCVSVVPLGKPINEVRIYLLDEQLRPVADGEAGEICIGGPTVGLGYLGHPELTAEKFPLDPFTVGSGNRLYRTGDLGRLTADGTLEFQGRIDNQTKIRGHRVEPVETESAVLEHKGVREVVVIASEDQPGNTRLIAYVAPHDLAAPAVDGRERYKLPNNMAVVQQNKHETDFFYQQIFVDQTNFKHGITLHDGACVFDVGANIGFFTLFVEQIWQNVRVFAFEPIPTIFETLRVNASLYGKPHGAETKLFQCGLAEESGAVEFTFYPNSTSQSGRYGDEADEREVLRSIIGNVKPEAEGQNDQYLDALVESRVNGEKVVCQLRTLSEIIRAEAIARIDLLKIDVEKSELDVLAGIAADDWEKIQQIVIEAHDVDGHLARLVQLLGDRGYQVVAEQDDYLNGSSLYNVYATRLQTAAKVAVSGAPYKVPTVTDSIISVGGLRRYLQAKLPDYLVPAEIVLVENLPRLPNGKVDRQALNRIEWEPSRPSEDFVAPLSPVEEQLAQIWSDVLRREAVSTDDNFFDLGGDSILVMQIVARAARAGLRLTPRLIFKHQTIAELATTLAAA